MHATLAVALGAIVVTVATAANNTVSFFAACNSSYVRFEYSATNDAATATSTTPLFVVDYLTADVTVDYSPLYYWMYLENTPTLLSSGTFTFPTTGCNAVGYVLSSDDSCAELRIELDSSFANNSAVVYINALGKPKDVYLSSALQGTAGGTVPSNSLVVQYGGALDLEDETVAFCDTGGGGDCMSSFKGDASAPAGGAIFMLAYVFEGSYSAVYPFTGVGTVSWAYDYDYDWDDDGISDWTVLGIGFGVLAACCCCLLGVVLLKRRKANKKPPPSQDMKLELKKDYA